MAQQHILFLAAGLEVGGAEKFAVSLANALDATRFRITFVSFSHSNPLSTELQGHIRFLGFGRSSKLDVRPLRQLRALLQADRPDTMLAIGLFPFFLSVCAGYGMKSANCRFISYHSMFPRNRKEYLLTKFYSRLLRKNDRMITVSSSQATYTSNRYHIPAQQFHTIHNGVDTSRWTLPPADFNKTAIRKKYDLPVQAPVIVSVGMMRHEKNHLGAVKALQELHESYGQKAFLLLAGDGPMRAAIEEEVRSLQLEAYVRFTGVLKDVRPLYWASDLFVLSSFTENFSIAALEAMACGLPCVLTDVGGAAEMIVPGMNGLLSHTASQEMARQWSHALHADFQAEKIHAFVHEKFEHAGMIRQYTAMLTESTC